MQSIFSVSRKRFFRLKQHKVVYEKSSVSLQVQREGGAREPVYRDDYVILSFDNENGILSQEWRGFCPGADFKAAIDLIFNFMTEKNIYKTICDVRCQRVVSPSCQKYVEEKVLAYIRSHGSFITAFVSTEKSPGGVCAKLYDIHLTQKTGYRVNCFFQNMEDAEKWLIDK